MVPPLPGVSVGLEKSKQHKRLLYYGYLLAEDDYPHVNVRPAIFPPWPSAKSNMPFPSYLTRYRMGSTEVRLFFTNDGGTQSRSKTDDFYLSLCNEKAILFLWMHRADVVAMLCKCQVLLLNRWLVTPHLSLLF